MKTKEIANLVKGNMEGDEDSEISKVASLRESNGGDISFLESSKSGEDLESIGASCLLVYEDFVNTANLTIIRVKNPKLEFARIAAILHPRKTPGNEIHSSALIAENSNLASDVFIGAFCCVGENTSIGAGSQLRAGAKLGDDVAIGENCILYPNVFVEDGSVIGNNVVLHSGVVIGSDGFGFVRGEIGYVKFPQIGTVVIEDNVEIGANSCVDRGSLGETRIGEGTKIDNLVQVAHNVQIGKRVVIAAQTGISGSVVIEDDCIIGGQVGFGDHSTVKSGAIIGSKAGILPGKIVREGVWWGVPVQPLDEYKRQNAHVKALPRLRKQVKDIAKILSESKKK